MTIADIYMAKNLLVDLLNYQVTTDTLENLMLDFLVFYTDGTDLRSTAPFTPHIYWFIHAYGWLAAE